MSTDPTDPADLTDQTGLTDQTDPDSLVPPSAHSTSARNLLTVSLRVLGLCLICRLVLLLPGFVTYVACIFGYLGQINGNPIVGVFTIVLHLVVALLGGVGLILLAGRISRRFYPQADREADAIVFGTVGAGDLYYIASFVMGIYALLCAVEPAVRVLGEAMGAELFVWDPWGEGEVTNMISAAVYSVSGLALIFGGPGIAQAMAGIPRQSDEAPLPQFSIRLLLILGVALAIILGILRTVMVGIQ